MFSPEEALISLKNHDSMALLDVRSEKEFGEGHLPGFVNIPILNDQERHEVGLAYKEQGQEKAIEIGVQSTLPHRDSRTRAWMSCIEKSPLKRGLISCWRGGIRSNMALEWILSQGGDPGRIQRIEGGYQAMRRILVKSLEVPPDVIVLSGLTGSGKTRLLREVTARVLDLELHARHRGSAFGALEHDPQPSQATFENRVALDLFRQSGPFFVEDESSRIGSCMVPGALMEKIQKSRLVLLETPLEQRVENIFEEYVRQSLELGISPGELQLKLQKSISNLRRRLGGALEQDLQADLKQAFSSDPSGIQVHSGWIGKLLVEYYDKMYQYGLVQKNRPLLFRGDYPGCRAFMESYKKVVK